MKPLRHSIVIPVTLQYFKYLRMWMVKKWWELAFLVCSSLAICPWTALLSELRGTQRARTPAHSYHSDLVRGTFIS